MPSVVSVPIDSIAAGGDGVGRSNGLVVFVPRTAVVRDKTTDSYQIFTIEDMSASISRSATARLRVVVTGDPEGDQVRIAGGLTGNETVATSNQGALYDGASVQVK